MEDTNIPMPFTAEMCSCCRSKQCYKDIKTEYNWMGQKEVYEEMLFSTFNITIYQDCYSIQDAPQICEVCIKRLRDACNLKKQVLECQRTIVEYFNSLQKCGNPMVEIKLELSNDDVAEDETMSDEESEVKRKHDSDAMGEDRDDVTESCNIDNDLEFSTEIKLNWDKKKTLLFIGKYKEHQILWNPSHPEHFHKVKKNAAWVKLAQDMRITVKECQKKITSLLASLRREKARVRKSALGTGKGAKKVYTSSWFAYKALSFVLNRFTPRVTDNAIRHTEKETLDKNLLLDSNYDTHEEPSLDQVETNLKKVTQKPEDFKKPNLEPQKCIENQSFNLPKDLFAIDECISYGIFVSNKLKLYSKNTRAYVQHNVSNILFNADRGEYEQTLNILKTFFLGPPKRELAPEELNRANKLKKDTVKILKNTNLTPFRWYRNKYQCFSCKSCFEDFSSMKKHLSNHSFEEIKTVVEEKFVHHKVEATSLKCTICSKTLNYKELKTHLRLHNIQFDTEEDLLIPFLLKNAIQCAVCGENFTVFHTLTVHMNVHYKNHICELCGQSFISDNNYRRHLDRHNKVYKCKQCNLVFHTEHQREKHGMKFHKTVQKRVCPYCPERFNTHYKRLLHMIKDHNHKKPEYKCPSCEKTFFRQFLVNSHVRKFHMKERRYECGVCSQKFFGLFDMNQHVETHGQKKYSCSFCGKSYSRKRTLNDHVVKSHNIA